MFNQGRKAENIAYSDFLKDISAAHEIPSLQRPYEWAPKEIKKIWDDIHENDEGYFIGTIVFIAGSGSVSRDSIVDGQQRITTLSLFIIAIRDFLAEHYEEDEYDKDQFKLLLTRINELSEKRENRLFFSNENINEVYSMLVNSEHIQREDLNDIQNNVRDNYEYIKSLIVEEYLENKLKKTLNFLQKIKSLELVYIKCENENSAYALFEGLNSTGMKLAPIHLIKNALFKFVRENGTQEDLQEVELQWLELEDIFSSKINLLNIFIRHQWISQGDYISNAKLFDHFKEKVIRESNINDVKGYVIELLTDAKIYIGLREANEEVISDVLYKKFDIDRAVSDLRFLSYLNVDQVYAPMLYLFKKNRSGREDSIVKDFSSLVAFSFLMKYLPVSPSAYEKNFANLSKNKEKFKNLRNELFTLSNNQKESFIKTYVDKVKYVRGGKNGHIEYALWKFILSENDKSIKLETPTIEHIIAQDYDEEIIDKFKSKKNIRRKINSIGNLTVIPLLDNTNLSNKPFIEKKIYFKEDGLKENRNILNYTFESSPESAIDQRSQKVADKTYDVFIAALSSGKWPLKPDMDSEINGDVL